MGVPAAGPEDTLLSLARGEMTHAALHVRYAESGRMAEVDWRSRVPFRLSRGMQQLLTPFGLAGPVGYSMSAVAGALVRRGQWVASSLALHLRNDTLAWHTLHAHRPGGSLADGGARTD